MTNSDLTNVTGLDVQPERINGVIPKSGLHGMYAPKLTSTEIASLVTKDEIRDGLVVYNTTLNIYQGRENGNIVPMTSLTSLPYISVQGGEDDVYTVPVLPASIALGNDNAGEDWAVIASKDFNVVTEGVNKGALQYVGTTFPSVKILVVFSFSVACSNLGGGALDFFAQIRKNNVDLLSPAYLQWTATGVQSNLANNLIIDVETNDLISINLRLADAPEQPMNVAGATVTLTTVTVNP